MKKINLILFTFLIGIFAVSCSGVNPENNTYGIDETKDAVNAYYKACEQIPDGIENPDKIFQLTLAYIPFIVDAVNDTETLKLELSDLQIEEIEMLVSLSNNYNLLPQYKYIFETSARLFLIAIQARYELFTKNELDKSIYFSNQNKKVFIE